MYLGGKPVYFAFFPGFLYYWEASMFTDINFNNNKVFKVFPIKIYINI